MTIKFGGKPTVASRGDAVNKRLGPTTGTSKGKKPLPKPKISLKGTRPDKGEYALTWKKKL